MSLSTHSADTPSDVAGPLFSNGGNHVVLMVEDYRDARPELKHVLELNGYRVIDTDNGQEASRVARQTHPDLLLLDMDVPLIYGLVAARQIIKHAELGPMPVVIITHEDIVDPAPMMEVGASRNEYVTRLREYEELQPLLDYLLPILSPTRDAGSGTESLQTRGETIRSPLFAASAPERHLHRDVAPGKLDPNVGQSVHRTSMYKLLSLRARGFVLSARLCLLSN